ncbi:MAG: Flp pilus assembly complex ATPase component TadA [Lachnospiraceae bacterium]|nr:Flp pilus assembly complex ATPase component TadA [Lachnospiraceae bacterium]
MSTFKNIPIGEVLKEYGYITEEQIAKAVAYQKQNRGKRFGAILIELGFVTEKQMLEALAARLNLKKVEIDRLTVDSEAVAKIPQQLAEKYMILGVKYQGNTLTVVVNDPLNFYGLEDIRQTTGCELSLLLSEKDALTKAIHYYYADIGAKRASRQANASIEEEVEVEEMTPEDGEGEVPVINLLNSLIQRAYSTRASDIHIEPFENKTVVRMRVDGVIVEFVTLKKMLHAPLIARIKILSNLDIAERRIPQDGHFRAKVEGEQLNVRVSMIPTVFGEKAVLRLLSGNAQIDNEKTFGMNEADYVAFSKMLQAPNGLIYLTGPTGSGKTTTLYMVLEKISREQVNISTIEDPVEKNLSRVNQMQVNLISGLDFESGLRALLRQDPDVIMVGETRDAQTAEISIRAAITGHRVFSTLHTNDAVSTIIRLVDMGAEPYLIANSLVGAVAQRLMRKLCPNCKKERETTEEERALLGSDVMTVHDPVGCPYCNGIGYTGRIAIHEIFRVDREIRKMITQNALMEDIEDYAIRTQGMRKLKDSAVSLVKQGVTSMEEMLKIAYYTE